jgi:outer membrane protein TolC
MTYGLWLNKSLFSLTLLGCTCAMAQVIPDSSPATNGSSMTPTQLAALSPQAFLQLLVSRSVEVQYSKLSSDVARLLKRGEEALYEPVGFMGIREEGRSRQRTPDERLQNTMTAGTAILNENAHSEEVGIRKKLPTGAEVALSYKVARKSNNLIGQTSAYDAEYNTLLNLTLKQPLLRNAGRAVTETDRLVADLEHQIALQQLTQQTLKSSVEGLNLYWQLHRAQETLKLRQEAVASTQSLIADSNARVAAGKLPSSAVLELQGVLLNRQAELSRSQQALHDAQSKLFTAINLVLTESSAPGTAPFSRTSPPATARVSLAQALDRWSPYQIGLLKHQQAQIRLNFARNQMFPVADFVLSYSGTGYGNKVQDTRNVTEQGSYPDWYFGVNLEFPLNGNQKSQQQFLAQSARVTQAELEISAIQNSFANDFIVRANDLSVAYQLLESSLEEVKLRQSIHEIERQRVNLGVGLLSALIQKQVDLTEAKQRQLENQVRYELALATWQYIQGSLLAEHQIEISAQVTAQQ